MKLIFTLLLSVSFHLLIAQEGDKYKIKRENSSVEWLGKKVTGSHGGTIELKDGEILLENGKITSGIIYIDMTTIIITDIKDEKSNAKLLKHLVSPSFFHTEEYPIGKLKIEKVELQSGNQYIIFGNLSLKDITQRIEIPSTILMEENKIVAIGETKIDRTKFDIRYGSNSFFDNLGDKAILDDFVVKFKVGAVR